MKIGEAQKIYSSKLNQLRNQKQEYMKQQEKVKDQKVPSAEKPAVVLKWSDEKEKELSQMQKFMDTLMELKTGLENMENTKQQTDAAAEAGEDMAKCITTARRIAKGDKVPAYDEKRLMEFSFEMYMSAKNMAVLNANKRHKKHDSLWDEDEDSDKLDPSRDGYVDDRELAIAPPEISASSPESETEE